MIVNFPRLCFTFLKHRNSTSTHFKELLFTFIKNFNTLCIVWLILCFLLQRKRIENHVVIMHIITTLAVIINMRTNYPCHVANINDI